MRDRSRPWGTVTPEELAADLGVSAKVLRAWLRLRYPRSPVEHRRRWFLNATQVAAAHAHWGR